MSHSLKLDSYPEPETVCRYGVADGRPVVKKNKTMGSLSRLHAQLESGMNHEGEPLDEEETRMIQSLIHNRVSRLQQLAGGVEDISARQNKHRIDMLRRSNVAKITRFRPIEKSA